MPTLKKIESVGIIGSGAMGTGIALVFAQAGYSVCLLDTNNSALERARQSHLELFQKLIEKDKIKPIEAEHVQSKIHYSTSLEILASADLVIEAIVEDLGIKQSVFKSLESIVATDALLATNTSSLSITSIAKECKYPQRVVGIHFFNPATRMPLVEIIPSLQTDPTWIPVIQNLIKNLSKTSVMSRDLPGFIVNRIARPFYGEALRIWEEGLASIQTIDQAMKEYGGFKMGPFELMDFIGHDVNFRVAESVFQAFYYDPRYKPSLTQKRLFEAGHYGRKSKIGFFDYKDSLKTAAPIQAGLQSIDDQNKQNGAYEKNPQIIFERILAMLINEAADALYLQVANRDDLDLAVIKGLNYPKGLLKWCDEIGLEKIITKLEELRNLYQEDRYRTSPLLKNKMLSNEYTFY